MAAARSPGGWIGRHRNAWRVLLALLVALALLAYVRYAWAATFTVTSTADTAGSTCGAACTLRQAITAANAAAGGTHTINFNISGCGSSSVCTISPASALPTITHAVVIDGSTQPGWTANPVIQINGGSAGNVDGLTVNASGSTLRELNVNSFNKSGVYLTAGSSTVQGCWIGLNAAGTAAAGNDISGIAIASSSNTIGGTTAAARNVVSGNGSGNGTGNAGILIISGTGNTLQGNYVGLNAAGTAAVANWPYGIDVSSASNTIGGTAAGAGNVASGHQYDGLILRPGSDGTLVQGNNFGGNAANSAALGNSRRGITVQSGSNTIGGTAAGAGNVLRGNGGAGLDVEGNVNGNAILGNSIFGNSGIGIDLNYDGQTSNDGAKTSGQPNLLMDYPVFTQATLGGTTLTVAGYVGSAAGQSTFASARVEVFISDVSNTNGQGKTYLGYLTTDASGNFSGTIGGVSGVTGGSSKITGTATDGSSNTSEFGPNLTVANLLISGTVFEDVNYGGGAGRNYASAAAAGGAGASGATVELYSAAGSYVASTTTAANGGYSFSGYAPASYLVRVLPSSVRSTRTGSSASAVPVQTYRYESSGVGAAAVSNEVGGARPDVADSAAAATLSWTQCATESGGSSNPCSFSGTRVVRLGTGSSWYARVATSGIACSTANFGDPAFGSGKTCEVLTPHLHSVSSVSTAAGASASADFGFNFDAVVNTNDSGIGSLRQAITNANTLGGDASLAQSGRAAAIENLVFMISDGSAAAGLRSANDYFTTSAGAYDVATITPTSALPALSTAMVIDAQTQPGWSANPIVEVRGDSAGSVHGLTLSASGSTLRGLIVNRFPPSGIQLSASGNTVQGCWVGLNAAGTAAAGNGAAGIYITAGSNTVGGTTAARRNVVSGNGGGNGTNNAGILISSGSGNTVQGNYVGLNAAGTAAVANLPYGVDVTGTGSVIGSTTAGAGNVIAGNTLDGIILRPGADSSTLQGNWVGTDSAGTTVVANGRIGIDVQSNNNTVGGTAAGAGNLVRGNTNTGVSVVGNATGNAISANSIWGNGSVGIDLKFDGQTGNDGAKTSGQPNLLMDYPVFTSASLSGTTLSVAGYVGSAAGQSTFASSRVEVFISDLSNTNGQGKTYLGYLTADASGNFSGTFSGVSGITTGTTKITGTATDGSNNTSEFGPNLTVANLSLSGTVFEDVNYGGGAGRSVAGSGGAGVTGATVELYDAAGSYVSSTTTASGGGYSFGGLAPNTSYHVRVAGSTVASTRSGSTAALVGVLTYRTTAASGSAVAVTDVVGGTNPALVDPGAASGGAAFNTTTFVYSAGPSGTAQAVAPASIATSPIAGLDFGFNFDTVVNTSSAGAGSLRQAIVNANTLGGDASLAQSGRTAAIENLVFMLSNGSAGSGLRSGYNYFATSAGGYNVATITPTSALPGVTAPLVIDAQTQPGWALAPLIELNGASAGGSSGLVLNAAGTTLRGFVINRFGVEGVTSTAGAGIVIQGNYIGTNAAGTAASANANSAIWLNSSAGGHQIGGTTAAQRNVLSGQTTYQGVAVLGGSGTVIQGNYIGSNAAGTAAIANGSDGVKLYGGVSNSTIGGTAAGAGNLIRGNGGRGVNLLNGATGNAILGNSIYGNASIGIDLDNDGQTSNDGAKTSGRANLDTDYPVFTSASLAGTTLSVAGYVGSAAGQSTFASSRVEVFISDVANTNGQGKTYLGYLTADASGNFSGTIGGVSGITTGTTKITGTATDGSNNTSEFGPNLTVASLSLSGTVFEDVNYGGGAGRSLAASSGTGVSGATVELYSSGGSYVSSTTTAAGGGYSFAGVQAGTGYFVRVAGPTVASTRSGSTASLVGVLTYRTTAASGSAVAVTDFVGGTNPALADPAAASSGAAFNTTSFVFSAGPSGTAQAVAPVSVGTGSISGLDFGFNFDTVVNTSDGGAGSLRQAITNANTLGGDASLAQSGRTAAIENIVFMVSNGSAGGGLRSANTAFSGGVATIAPASALPTIGSPLVLDAQAQPGWSSTPVIDLDGSGAGAAAAGVRVSGFTGSTGVTLRGFVIRNFGGDGIRLLSAGGHVVAGNHIGVNAAGTAAAANGGLGISIFASGGSTIGGSSGSDRNVISGNGSNGMTVSGSGATGNVISGNYVGTNAAGTAAIANGSLGIYIGTAGNTVGGTAAGAGNVISGNTYTGLVLDTSASGSTVQGNTIGLNAAGTASVPNGNDGVQLVSASNTVGGSVAGAGNVISGNTNHGLRVEGASNTIAGNTIGLNAARTAKLANSIGILVNGVAGSTIGGTTAAAANTVAGNSSDGIRITGGGATGTLVQGNWIGSNGSGAAGLGNGGNGVLVSVGAASNTIGGTGSGAGNAIRNNTGRGVSITGAGSGNAVQRNGIDGNGQIGIDLAGDGQTTNDGATTSGQPNLLTDYPVFTSASLSGSTLTLAGYVGSAAGQSTFASARVEVFISDLSNTNGQGKTYLGYLTADASGNFSGTISGVSSITTGTSKLTGTATDGSNNTSEFGPNLTVASLGLSGTVFEDVNYGGGAGRSLAASSGAGVTGATVELYSAGGTYISSTTTAAGGGYSFAGVQAGTGYFVRVVGPTVASTRSGSTAGLVGVLTYRTTAASGSAVAVTDVVGGTNPALADPGAASSGATFNTTSYVFSAGPTGTAQAVAPVSVGTGDIAGIDFGFNFDTVVNTNNAGAGSLRQALTNANTLGGDASLAQSGRTAAVENLVFMIGNGSAGSGLRSAYNYFATSAGGYNVATIAPTSALPTVSTSMVIDAQTQPGWTLAPLIELNGSSAGSNVSGFLITGANTTVRGFVVNRFGGEGIDITATGGCTVQGNYLGTNAAGSAASANTKSGVWIHPASSTGHLVGGTTAAQRNVISGNTLQGVAISFNTGAVVSGNYIGVNAANTATIGNQSAGVVLYASVQSATVGGTAAGAGNVVAGNGAGGVALLTGATGNAVLGNSIYGNAYIGIDLGANGQTTNDGAKISGRANLEMDYPVFTSASLAGSTLSVAGYVGSAAGQSTFASARVEVFVSDVANTNGQGKTYLGYLTADASGNFSGTISGVSGITTGTSKITATATDSSNNTSEFGPNLTVASLSLSGTVFEDVNYGGGAGRSLAASSGAGVAGVTVELYDASGSYVSSTTTAAGGGYSFAGVAANTAYFVRVAGPTVASTRSGSTAALVGVLTYRTTAASGSAVAVTDMVGGSNPTVADPGAASGGAAFNTASYVFGAGLSGTAQAVAPASVGVGAIAGLDFGFNFDTVVNTGDSGAGSLRQAITNANTLGGDASLAQSGRTAAVENIVFMLPNGTAGSGLRSAYNAFTTAAGSGWVATMMPASALPSLATAMVIDAQTQPGWSANPIIELRGSSAGSTGGLTIGAGGVVLRGLIVNRFSGTGITISSGSGSSVQGCWIGTSADGSAAAANTGTGVSISSSGSGGQQVGGTTGSQRNVISGNGGYGIYAGAGGAHSIQGNYIGTNAAGSAAVGNGGRAVVIDSGVTSATLGGTTAGAGNVISGNGDYAVWLAGGAATLQGNLIGLNAAGTAALANSYGIFASSGGHQIGGTAGAARNVVSGNTARGIWLNSANNTVQGNYVGTNAAGTAAIGNGSDGIYSKGTNNVIGGTAAGAGNLVSGNGAAGILLNAVADGTTVQGNTVGLNAARSAALANAVGINVQCSSGCAIGGSATGAGNTVSGNTGNGVQVAAGSSGNAIQGNAIWNNGSLGIDLNNDGVSANDGAKTSGQANLLMDSPVITSARSRGSALTIAGYVGSAAGQSTFASSRVEFFVSDNDASGYGEGKTYLGYLTSDASGNFSGTLTMPVGALAIGSKLTATATDTGSNTSEFGASFGALVVDLVVNSNLDEADSSAGDGSCLTASGVCTLRAAIAELNAQGALSTTPVIAFAIPGCTSYGSAGCRITPATALPSITRALSIDATTQSGWNATSYAPLIEIDGSAAPAATAGLVLAANGSTLRGLTINRFGGNGITVSGTGNTIAGNSIGLDAAASAAAANGGAGISLTGSGNTVGGTVAADRNIISGNTGHGILVGASNSTIAGNAIGSNASGSSGLGNGGSGVQVQSASLTGIAISGNTIANNTSRGVGIAGGGSAQVSILGNAVSGNGALGIDLGNDGVSANTGSLNGSLPNSGMNMPVITGAGVAPDGLSVQVYGYVGTGSGQAAFAGARVEIFKAAADGSGYGEGLLYLGALTADASGRFSGTLSIASGSLAVGDAVTGTATLSGSTSEFGADWTATSVAGLSPAGFNAFETGTAAGALTGVITSKTAGSAANLAVIALDNSGTALHPGFSGTVSLTWLDARDDSGAASGSCRSSWVAVGAAGSAGSAVFSNASRVTVSVTPPAAGTRAMRLKMTYTSAGNTVTACSNDAFADLPASIAWVNASDADSATAGTGRVLANTGVSGGVVHRAGRPFTVRAQALDASGALMTGYDGSPALAASGCLLPSGCSAAAVGGSTASASAGVYTNNTVTYAEVGALQLQLTDSSYGAIDAADTAAAARTVASSSLSVGRFVPDSLVASISTSGQFATGNGACMASGQGATFIGQGFGWTTAPQVTVAAYNAAGGVTTRWTGTLMKLAGGNGTPSVAVSGNGSAGFSASYGALSVTDLGSGQARVSAAGSDRFVLDLPAGSVQASVTPTWSYTLAIADASEAATTGNPTLVAGATQTGVGFDLGAVFHSGRLALAPAIGDARRGVQALLHLQRWTSAGWVTMTEDQGCITVQRANLGVESPSGVFATAAGACAAPLTSAAVSTRGGRAWLALPGTPAAAPGRLALRLAGAAASGNSCTAGGATATLTPMGLPWLLGGTSGAGPAALATWGRSDRDTVLRRETW